MKVFISSTSEDLRDYRKVVEQVVLDAQWQPLGMEHFPNDPRPIVQLCREEVAKCGLVILLQAFRRGWVPEPAKGGDGATSVTAWEIKAADERKIDVLAFLADDNWPGRLWERDAAALHCVDAFRNGLNRNAKFFGWETGVPTQFRSLVRESLALHRDRIAGSGLLASVPASTVQPRRVSPEPVALPPEPYPLLGPYEDPRLFAGREAEIDELSQLIRLPPLVLCLHAPSGAGKSSLLLAGLAPRLRADHYLVSVERAPGDPGLARRLVSDVLTIDHSSVPADDDGQLPTRFAGLVREAYGFMGKPVVFVLDQIDDVLRSPQKRQQALATIGTLLAATAQRLPGEQGFACKWVLCYRHEFHGEMRAWLKDVLAEAHALARSGLSLLPSDFTDPQKSSDWAVPVVGRVSSDGPDAYRSRDAFRRAIERPLEAGESDRLRYPYVLSGDGAERLAGVFAEFRRDQPEMPLVPELQVVLNHLLRSARERSPSGAASTVSVDVPQGDDLRLLIRHALSDHVEEALNRAFPPSGDCAGGLQARTRALLALRQLVDDEGRRTEGLLEQDVIRMIGPVGAGVLATFASADMRLVVVDAAGRCALSHDCLAEAVSNVLSSPAARRSLALDQGLIDLQRTVGQKTDLYLGDGRDASALMLKRRQRQTIRANQDLLIASSERRAWWVAVRRAHVRRLMQFYGVVALAVAGMLIVRWTWYAGLMRNDRALLRHQLVDAPGGKPNYSLLVRLSRDHPYPWTQIPSPLPADYVDRVNPEVFCLEPWKQGTVELAELLDVIDRGHAVLLGSRQLFGAMSVAVEEVALRSSDPAVRDRAQALWMKIREDFIAFHKTSEGLAVPPTLALDEKLNPWRQVREGNFLMGSEEYQAERPPHPVHISEFFMQQHEVTNDEYRRFDPTHRFKEGEGLHPAVNVSWYEASAYAAWLGGSLPTEAQWEYAARGTAPNKNRRYPWADDQPLTSDRAVFDTSGTARVGSKPAGRTPEQLDDMVGNVWEWCRDLHADYPTPTSSVWDPLGAAVSEVSEVKQILRVLRGGSFGGYELNLRATYRGGDTPDHRNDFIGFRLVSSRPRP